MYPTNLSQPYPFDQWWVGAMSHEVGRAPMLRTLLGEPVVFYRTEAGRPVAMQGLCPHRMYPMGRGKLKGDAMECGYHGFTFDSTGACIRIPSQDHVPANFRARVYPVAERGQWIWIWMGDPERADAGLVPDPPCLFKPGWEMALSRVDTYPARYQILLDNLFDLSHLGFIHASIVGEVNEIVKEPPVITETDGIFRVTRDSKDNPYAGFGDFMFGPCRGTHYDSDVSSDYYGPCLVLSGGGFRIRADRARDGGEQYLGSLWFVHAVTPETPRSTHYFGGVSRDFNLGDEAYSRLQVDNYHAVRDQDIDALSAIEPWIDTHGNTRKELSAFQDGGAIRVRRMLAAQIEAEMQRGAASRPVRG